MLLWILIYDLIAYERQRFDRLQFNYRKANATDYDEIFDVVNSAYSVKIGNTGRAFKTANRYTSKTQDKYLKEIPYMWILKEKDSAGEDIIVGCVGAKVTRDTVTIGPLAVRPNYQV